MQDELFSAAAGEGAWLNDHSLKVSAVQELADAVVGLDWSRHHLTRQSTADVVTYFADRSFTLRALGSAALAMAWTAAGRLDAYLNYNVYPWDVAAAHLLIEEAGGLLTDLRGEQHTYLLRDPFSCLMSNGRVHQELLAIIQAAEPSLASG
jgi:myo-inositol-1(or 4)-monophosphatase